MCTTAEIELQMHSKTQNKNVSLLKHSIEIYHKRQAFSKRLMAWDTFIKDVSDDTATFEFSLKYEHDSSKDQLVTLTQNLSLETSPIKKKKYCGLYNMGCYWNAILQFMFHTKAIRDVVLETDAKNKQLTKRLIDVFNTLDQKTENPTAFKPKKFFEEYKAVYNGKICIGTPEDVHEILFQLLQNLHKEDVELDFLFKGRHRRTKYKNGVKIESRDVEFQCIDLPIHELNKCEY